MIQGSKITDPNALAQLHKRGLPEWETAVEIPAGLLKFLPLEDS
ncbi:hypothetical protein C791_7935 [Amycolatopsis azurea DSM 43854]|uniref:Uncharacterized protein n=1 Tax=Amycolatopsis azurea DSM 43854 TaxID=1238180 RepID=M2PTV0_9PSEU|nr:hypothetical protein C791_7935 [Amycolatopsis azurea DSM 43854]